MRIRPYLRVVGLLVMGSVISPAFAQIDYSSGQRDRQVWERKQFDRTMDEDRSGNDDRNSAGIAYNDPLSPQDLERSMATYRSDYQELLRSVGKKNADRWLEMKTRIDRSKR